MRPLHWVIKSGDLKSTVDFYAQVCGLKVLRHEEFLEGCEAACNGRYGGAWSKTIVGKTSELDGFCLEIVYNWGIPSYSRGNAFRRLKVLDDPDNRREKAAEAFWAARGRPRSFGRSVTEDPDGNLLEFVRTAKQPDVDEDFLCLSLNVANLKKSVEFYSSVLQATILERKDDGSFGSIPEEEPSQLIRFGPRGTAIELVQLPEGTEVEFGSAQGRFATETVDGEPDALAKRAGPNRVIHGPLQLPPHNERVVVVTDLDGHEYAFVEASGYARCIVAGAREIDWKYREEFAKTSRQKKHKTESEDGK